MFRVLSLLLITYSLFSENLGSIKGSVKDGFNFLEAVVSVENTDIRTISGYDGYILSGIKPGDYKLKVKFPGYETIIKDVIVRANETTIANIITHVNSGKLKGCIMDEKGEPIEGAVVLIEGTDLGAETDEDGFYYIRNIVKGNHKVSYQYIGKLKLVIDLKIRAQLSTKQNVYLINDTIDFGGTEFKVKPLKPVNY